MFSKQRLEPKGPSVFDVFYAVITTLCVGGIVGILFVLITQFMP